MSLRFVYSKLNVNLSDVEEFELLGLVSEPALRKVLFVVFCFIYIMTVIGNLMIIIIIRYDSHLHKPMYFFLMNLSFLEIFYTTTITPNSLKNFLQENRTISFVGCFTQMFFFIGLGSSECVLLSCMAYDRYAAICQPLFYNTIMNPYFCIKLMVLSWSIGFSNSLVHTVYTASLPFCRERLVNHFFCDIPSVAELSCSETRLNELVSILIGGGIILASFTLTLISYVCIFRAVLNIHSASGKQKAFSTCGSHLLVFALYFGTVILTYVLPGSSSYNEQKRVLSVMYGIVTPFMNPLIYSFRNNDFQNAINKKLMQRQINLGYK
ncbi:PREDICTED: olfactory receptor 8I2-like [Nanorana parkeri]|uniref:olfactory receptor 8I2-like n=1 Tax=Nanorana parkeri TaxID=125878 RepID=UPI000854ADC4|nr:PREDICTED: olfactory receptor 8I2-like [Nanorana parkeri]